MFLKEVLREPDEGQVRILPLHRGILSCFLLILAAYSFCLLLLLQGWLPGFKWQSSMQISGIPAALAGVGLGMSALLAPFMLPRPEYASRLLGHGVFCASWQAAMLGFFLLIASRLIEFEDLALLQALFVLAITAFAFLMLVWRWPQAYAGLVLGWVIVMPLTAYLWAEIYLETTGHVEWQRIGPDSGMPTIVKWLLLLSPGTLLMGALHRHLPGQQPLSSSELLYFALFASAWIVLARPWQAGKFTSNSE